MNYEGLISFAVLSLLFDSTKYTIGKKPSKSKYFHEKKRNTKTEFRLRFFQ